MLETFLEWLGACRHARTTFPLSPRRRPGQQAVRASTYVVCLDCGKEFVYDWQEMRRLTGGHISAEELTSDRAAKRTA
jgi:hypothetical protein